MAAMATTRQICDGSMSEIAQGPQLYNRTNFHALMKK